MRVRNSKLTDEITGLWFQCCAVSFIENLTAESLNMRPVEFEQYMAGEMVSTSTWECALVICEVRKTHSLVTLEF